MVTHFLFLFQRSFDFVRFSLKSYRKTEGYRFFPMGTYLSFGTVKVLFELKDRYFSIVRL